MGCCGERAGVIARSFLYLCTAIGIVLSLMTVASCDFIRYKTQAGASPPILAPPFLTTESARVGLFRWNEGSGSSVSSCQPFIGNELYDRTFVTAQISSFTTMICATVALLLGTIEFVCARVCCSIFFLGTLFFFALICQALTYFILVSEDFCSSGRTCSLGIGAIFSLCAGFMYLVCMILVCSTPKPVPWCRRVQPEDDDTGCLRCCMKKDKDKDEDIPANDEANVDEEGAREEAPIEDEDKEPPVEEEDTIGEEEDASEEEPEQSDEEEQVKEEEQVDKKEETAEGDVKEPEDPTVEEVDEDGALDEAAEEDHAADELSQEGEEVVPDEPSLRSSRMSPRSMAKWWL